MIDKTISPYPPPAGKILEKLGGKVKTRSRPGNRYAQMIFGIVLTLFLISETPLGYSQDRYTVPRITGQVTLDGPSDETAWQQIQPLPVVMHVPNFGHEPSERTEILLAYDDVYLYLAGRLYDKEASKIQAPSKKRDEMGLNNDWFGLVLDTFNDNENGLAFFTTPVGLRLDMTVFRDAEGRFPLNPDWNTFWDVATKRNTDGWFVEMRIPLSSLRFQERNDRVVMGLITWRYIARKNETIVFPKIPPNWGFWSVFKPSQAQEILFKDIHVRKPLYITPYLLGGFGQSFELNDAETAYQREDKPEFEVGLDVKYGLTDNLTLDLTVNTDFAQVEADDQQINLTRFSLFFPEKRLFFQERASNFEFKFDGPNRLFYSRRIGIYDGKPVRIYGGVRLVGREGPWDVGLMNMQTAPIEDQNSENFGVLRLRRRVINPYTYIGSIVTSRIGTDGTYNVAYGLDGIFRLFGDDYMKVYWAQTFEDTLENKPLSLNPTRFGISWERRTLKGFAYDLSYSRSGRDFDPGIGFEKRDDYSRLRHRILYGWIPGEESAILRHDVFVNGKLILSNENNKAESSEVGPGWEFTLKSGYEGNISANLYYENVPDTFSISENTDILPGQYTFYGLEGRFDTPSSWLFNPYTTFQAGSFYDGSRISVSLSARWNVSSSLELRGYYQINRLRFKDRHQALTVHITRLKGLLMLSTKLSISGFIQYNSVIDAVITNIRFRYNPREGNDLYLVYDEDFNTHRHREDPVLPVTSSRTLLLKYTYTFNV